MRLKKFDMGLLSIVALGIGSIVGAGIFALLGQVVMQAGDKTYYAFVIAGIAALFSGYSYSKLAGKYPDSGGLTDYFKIAFKSKVISGFLSFVYYFTSAVSICMMAKSFGIYANELVQKLTPAEVTNIAAVTLILSLAFLNMMGSADVGRAEILLVGIKMFILLSIIVMALIKFDLLSDKSSIQPTALSFMGSVGITFFAYAGYGVITNAAADVANPRRTITLGIYLTILIVILMYIGLAFVVLNYIPAAELEANADTAVAIAAQKLFGTWGYGLIYFAAFIAFISGISATFFSIFRISQSLGEQGILPKFYYERFWGKASYGNVLSTFLILLATIYFDFTSIVNLASAAYLVSYLAIFVANWVLRKETKSSPFMILFGTLLMLVILIAFLISISM